jgi:hypothetical protein
VRSAIDGSPRKVYGQRESIRHPHRLSSPMSKFAPVQATRPGAVEADDSHVPVTLEVERIIRERLETFDEDAKGARQWEDVLADLKARRPLPPSPR